METSLRCPKCTKPLAAGAVDGLCPECLLRAGFATGTQPPAARTPFVPPTPAELAPLFPQLEIIALIGQGGMGAVYRARQPSLDRVVALKVLAPQTDRGPAFAERFTREARALARLSHPNIVGVFGTLIGVLFNRVSHLENRVENAEDYAKKLWIWARALLDLYYRHRGPNAPEPNPLPERD
jgi:hypothetical protein